jgi:chromosome partitioning protein
MGQIQVREDFPALFADPSIERLQHDLGDTEFEHFVGYIFQQAGYGVEHTGTQYGQGLDLKLYLGSVEAGTPYGGVSVKHYSGDTLVTGPQVMLLRGALHGQRGYVVTSNKLNGPAQAEADKAHPICALNGDHFVRYINYVRGTRQGVSANVVGHVLSSNGNRGFAPLAPDALLVADTIDRRASEIQVLTIANHKGGVGKTTSALNLAFGLTTHGKQVLLVDMDAQANLTCALAYPTAKQAIPRYLDEYFAGTCSLADLVSPTQFDPIWLIPSRHNLIRADKGLAAGGEAELQFARDLLSARVAPPKAINGRSFDWIIIDTGPWMGFFTRSALAASRYVIVPVSPSVFADMGIEFILETVSTMRALTGTSLDILGCLVTQWREDALSKSLLAKAEDALALARIPRIPTEIPLDKNNIEKAHLETGQGKTRTLFDRRCAAAKAYTAVVNEMLISVAPPIVQVN